MYVCVASEFDEYGVTAVREYIPEDEDTWPETTTGMIVMGVLGLLLLLIVIILIVICCCRCGSVCKNTPSKHEVLAQCCFNVGPAS